MTDNHAALPWRRLPVAILSLPWYIQLFAVLLVTATLLLPSPIPSPDSQWQLPEPAITSDRVNLSRQEIVTLPQEWQSHDQTTRWYHFMFSSSNPTDQALLIEQLQQDVDIWLNGHHLVEVESLNLTGSRLWNRPAYFLIPEPYLLTDKPNQLSVGIHSNPSRFGLLGRTYIGPNDELEPLWQIRKFHRKTSGIIITTGLFFLALFVAAIGFSRTREHIYLYFSLACFAWVIHNIPHLLPAPTGFSDAIWDIISYVSLGWMVIFIVIYDHRHAGHNYPKLERALILFGGITPIPMFFLPMQWLHNYAIYVWYFVIVSMGGYAMAFLAIKHLQRPDREIQLVIVGGIAIFGAGFHDYLVITGLMSRTDGFFIQYSGLPVMTIFSWFILKRFIRAMQLQEQTNLELEQRIAEREQELQKNFDQLRALENQQLISEERERIMQDMHDGVGGQLITTMMKLEQNQSDVDQVREDLRNCLTDLRLVIDSLDPSADDLTVLLAMVRNRLQPHFANANIQLIWQAGDIPTPDDFGPRKALHVMRIVQEAITNAIRHSNASSITFHSQLLETSQVEITIEDNGSWNNKNQHIGRGLSNMQKRAESIDAALSIDKQSKGTRVSLIIPLEAV